MRIFRLPQKGIRYVLLSVFAILAAPANAHSFVQPYTLPVPFAMYAFGAGAALVLSFVVVAVLAVPRRVTPFPQTARAPFATAQFADDGKLGLKRLLSVLLLLLCIASGIFGTKDAFQNINMTLFWIVLVLGIPYTVVIFGNFYTAINPWRAIVICLERLTKTQLEPRFRFPAQIGYLPAVMMYMAFICMELFGGLQPRGLSIALAVYTIIMVIGACLFGREQWLSRAEIFDVQCALLGRMAPLSPVDSEVRRRSPGKRLTLPFIGILNQPAKDVGLVLFILFMLSSTAFDGIHATKSWAYFYWREIHPWLSGLVSPIQLGGRNNQLLFTMLYNAWQWCVLIASPFLYLALFAWFVWLSKSVARENISMRTLLAAFAPTLLPIALAYHVSHYYTLVLWQAPQIVRLLSDPLGLGWNLFGTANWNIEPWTVNVGTIWHTQVALILAGHIVSVVLAHVEALRFFSTPARAALSQLPMLGLMVLFTISGLWILSLPLA